MLLGNEKEDKQGKFPQTNNCKQKINESIKPYKEGKGRKRSINRKGKKKWLRRNVERNEAAYFSFPCHMYFCHFEITGR